LSLIRPLQAQDLPQIWRINQANTPAVGGLDLAQLGRVVAQSKVALVVEEGAVSGSEIPNGKILGFVICMAPDSSYTSPNFLFFTQRYDRFLYIDRVAVAEASRGKGLGRRLYQALREQQSDPLACEVNTVPLNQSSLDFHAKLGFEPVGEGQAKGYGVRYLMRAAS
jgi:predicted GNAT superfamily acetyltransferase